MTFRLLVKSTYDIVASRKQRYLEFLKDLPYPEDHKQKIVRDAIDAFEREDRIMWFLRKARAADLAELASHPDEHFDQYKAHLGEEGVIKLKQGKETAKKKLEKMMHAPLDSTKGKERLELIEKEGKKLGEMITQIRHFLSNARLHGLNKVQDFIFPADASAADVFGKLQALENEELSKKPDERLVKQAEDERTHIQFPDGWRWVLIPRETCEREGKAMRHCGNTGHPKEGDQILSLREPLEVEVGDGRRKKKEKYFKPHATFILNNGVLGERKGYGNEKPGKNLHKYIIKLLEDDIVEHLGKGRHASSKDFSLKDLSAAERTALLRKKPNLDREGEPDDYDDNDDYEDDEEYEDE